MPPVARLILLVNFPFGVLSPLRSAAVRLPGLSLTSRNPGQAWLKHRQPQKHSFSLVNISMQFVQKGFLLSRS
jgi:hypothetical protein